MTFSRTSGYERPREACFAWMANQAVPSGKGIAEGTRESGVKGSRRCAPLVASP